MPGLGSGPAGLSVSGTMVLDWRCASFAIGHPDASLPDDSVRPFHATYKGMN